MAPPVPVGLASLADRRACAPLARRFALSPARSAPSQRATGSAFVGPGAPSRASALLRLGGGKNAAHSLRRAIARRCNPNRSRAF